jgi:hypothetical protein
MVDVMLIDFCRTWVLSVEALISAAPWCSGLTCHPVTVEIVGSNPIGVAIYYLSSFRYKHFQIDSQEETFPFTWSCSENLATNVV